MCYWVDTREGGGGGGGYHLRPLEQQGRCRWSPKPRSPHPPRSPPPLGNSSPSCRGGPASSSGCPPSRPRPAGCAQRGAAAERSRVKPHCPQSHLGSPRKVRPPSMLPEPGAHFDAGKRESVAKVAGSLSTPPTALSAWVDPAGAGAAALQVCQVSYFQIYATQQGDDHDRDIIIQSSRRDAPESGSKLADARRIIWRWEKRGFLESADALTGRGGGWKSTRGPAPFSGASRKLARSFRLGDAQSVRRRRLSRLLPPPPTANLEWGEGRSTKTASRGMDAPSRGHRGSPPVRCVPGRRGGGGGGENKPPSHMCRCRSDAPHPQKSVFVQQGWTFVEEHHGCSPEDAVDHPQAGRMQGVQLSTWRLICKLTRFKFAKKINDLVDYRTCGQFIKSQTSFQFFL